MLFKAGKHSVNEWRLSTNRACQLNICNIGGVRPSACEDFDVVRIGGRDLVDNAIPRDERKPAHPSCSHEEAISMVSMPSQ